MSRRSGPLLYTGAAMIATLTLSVVPSGAGSLTYTPINPAFGGSPLNNAFLLGTAQIQNQFMESSSGSSTPAINFPPIDIDLGDVGGGGSGSGGVNPPIIVIPLPNTGQTQPAANGETTTGN